MSGGFERVRVLYADAETGYRTRLTRALLAHRELDLVAVTVDGPSALAAAGRLRPDVVLTACDLPGMDGPELAGELARPPAAPVGATVLLGDSRRAGQRRLADRPGVRGMLDRGLTPERLCDVLAGIGAPVALAHA